MGFPENILTKDEKVVRSLHPHWLTVLKPILLGLLVVAVAIVVAVLTPDETSWNITEWVVAGIAVLVLIWIVAVPILRWRTTHYVITNKRVVVRRGILSKSGQDIALSKITDVSFRQSLLDRIIRAGSLNIETAGDSPDEDFSSIPRSNEIQQLLNHLIEEDAAAKGGFGQAAHRGHQMMSQRSNYPSEQPVAEPVAGGPDAPVNGQQRPGEWDTQQRPADGQQRWDTQQRPADPQQRLADPQQPPRFEQPTDGYNGQTRPYQTPNGQSAGESWETPPTR